MADILYVKFGAERVWDRTRQRLTDTLLIVGELFGDNDKDLIRAKADCAHAMIRKIVEEVPSADFNIEIPDGLPPDQDTLIREALQTATLTGIEAELRHSVRILTNSIYDLCTSKLSQEPHTDDQ